MFYRRKLHFVQPSFRCLKNKEPSKTTHKICQSLNTIPAGKGTNQTIVKVHHILFISYQILEILIFSLVFFCTYTKMGPKMTLLHFMTIYIHKHNNNIRLGWNNLFLFSITAPFPLPSPSALSEVARVCLWKKRSFLEMANELTLQLALTLGFCVCFRRFG